MPPSVVPVGGSSGCSASAHIGLFGDRQNALEVPAIIGPHFVVGENAAVRQFIGVVLGEGEAGAACAAAQGCRLGRAPDAVGDPVVAEDGDAGLAHIAHGVDHVLQLFFATVLAEHDLVIEGKRDIF